MNTPKYRNDMRWRDHVNESWAVEYKAGVSLWRISAAVVTFAVVDKLHIARLLGTYCTRWFSIGVLRQIRDLTEEHLCMPLFIHKHSS
jgi:hypothetical protein